jgi:hypothetical protein
MAAIAIALAGCGTSSTAGPTAAELGGSATPSETATAAAPGAGSPGKGSPASGSPSAEPSSGTGTGTGTGDGSGPGAGSETGERPGGGLGGDGTGPHPSCTDGTLGARLANRYAIETNRYVTLILTNTSRTTCTIRGWSRLQLVNGSGSLPTRVMRHGTPRTLTLPGHGYVWERLYWTSEPADDESLPCQATPTTLRVTPPGHTRYLSTVWNQGAVCGHGTISLTPVEESPAPVAG